MEDATELPSSITLLEQHDGGDAAVVAQRIQHASLLDSSDHRISALPAVRASGFLQDSSFRRAAAMAIGACVSFGLAMSMRSMSYGSTSVAPVGLRIRIPSWRRTAEHDPVARRDGLEHGLEGQIKVARRLQERVRVRSDP